MLAITTVGGVILWDVKESVQKSVFSPLRAQPPLFLAGDKPLLAGNQSPDGKTFALGLGKDAVLYELPGWRVKQVLSGHKSLITAISFSQDGKLLASGSWDRTVNIWESKD